MLKWVLDQLLWGYPHLVDFAFSEYADVRRRNIEQPQTRQNDREAALADSEKEVPPPPPPESSAELWAHAKAEDVNPEYHCGEGLPIPRGLAGLGSVGIPIPNSGLTGLCSSWYRV